MGKKRLTDKQFKLAQRTMVYAMAQGYMDRIQKDGGPTPAEWVNNYLKQFTEKYGK